MKKKTDKSVICIDCNRKKRAPNRTCCYSCKIKRHQAADPVRYAFEVHRGNARRRGIVYGLTLDDFRKFAIRTDYMNGRGKSATGFHIDRIKEEKGYFKGNIQVLTNSENIKKRIAYDWQTGKFKTERLHDLTGTDDHPF